MVLVEPSAGMLQVSRALNPECEHVQGDMRTVRLDRRFDLVFVHDAVCYMTTEPDLRRRSRRRSCTAGRAAQCCSHRITVKRISARHRTTVVTIAPLTASATWNGRGTPIRIDTTYQVDYAYLLRTPDGAVRVNTTVMSKAFPARGLAAIPVATPASNRSPRVRHSELEPGSYEVFVATRELISSPTPVPTPPFLFSYLTWVHDGVHTWVHDWVQHERFARGFRARFRPLPATGSEPASRSARGSRFAAR